MTQQKMAHWHGSEKTADHVREEIARRYGEEEAEEYDPQTNCFTVYDHERGLILTISEPACFLREKRAHDLMEAGV